MGAGGKGWGGLWREQMFFQAVPGQIFGLGDSQVVPGPWGRAEIATESLFAHCYILGGEVGQGISFKGILKINVQNYSFIQTKPSAPTCERSHFSVLGCCSSRQDWVPIKPALISGVGTSTFISPHLVLKSWDVSWDSFYRKSKKGICTLAPSHAQNSAKGAKQDLETPRVHSCLFYS